MFWSFCTAVEAVLKLVGSPYNLRAQSAYLRGAYWIQELKVGRTYATRYCTAVYRYGLVMFAGLSLFACGVLAGEPLKITSHKRPEDIRGEVSVWAWNIAAASLQELVPSFNKKYPNVKVNVHMTHTNIQSRLLLSLSARVGAPDISQLSEYEAPRYAATGCLTDLTLVAGRYQKNFLPSTWKSCVNEQKVYAIPWDFGPCAVFYKRHIFKRYGIDPDAIETWDDYIAAGKVILEKSSGKTKMLHLPTGQLSEMLPMLLQQNGGQIFDGQGRIAINSSLSLKVMNLLKQMLESGITANVSLWSHVHYASLTSDTVATYPLAAWWGGTIKDYAPETAGDWGVFRLPAFEPGGLRTSNMGGSVLVIPDQCKYKEATWAFVEFVLCTTQAQVLQHKNFDLFPAWLPALEDPFFDEPDPFFGGQKVRRLFVQDIEKIPPLNRTKDWPEAQRYLEQALSKWAARGMGPPEQFLIELETRLSRRLGREIAPSSLSLTQGD